MASTSISTPGFFSRLLGGLALSCLALGCGSNVEKKVALAHLSSTCRINTDCASPLVCVFQHCHQACDTSRDCAHDERCVQSASSRNVCQLPSEQGCTATGYCPGNEVCGVDAQCRDGCASDDNCVSEQVCTAGTCADQKELGETNALTPSPERPKTTPTPCAFDSDCTDGQRCISATCRVECSLNSDCPADQICMNARCQPAPTPAGCRYNSDCAKDELCNAGTCNQRELPPEPACRVDQDCGSAGQHCQQGQCVCECQTSGDCARGQSCDKDCACTADLVLHGDIVVQNDLELAELENVVEITGNLTIILPGADAVLHLPHLRKVKALYAYRNGVADPHLVFDVLEEATQSFQCSWQCEAPHLKIAAGVYLSSQVAGGMEFPELSDVQYLSVASCPRLERVSLPKVQSLSSLSLGSNPMLRELSLPALTKLGGLSINGDGFKGNFSLPSVDFSGYLGIQGNRFLTSFSLPGASNGADVYFTGNPSLTTISMPAAQSANRLYLEDLPQLHTVQLDALQSIANDLHLKGNFGSLALALPAVTTIATVDLLFTTGVVGLDLPELTHADRYSIDVSNIKTIDLPKLTSAGDVFLETNPDLTRLTLPTLASATSVYVGLADKLTQLDLSSLATVQNYLNIRITGIKDVATLDPTLQGKLTSVGYLTLTANPDLPSCLVTALQTHLTGPPYNWMGTFENQQNCDCPGACP